MCAMHEYSMLGYGRTCTCECRSETQNDVCALSTRYLPTALWFESVILVDNEERLPRAWGMFVGYRYVCVSRYEDVTVKRSATLSLTLSCFLFLFLHISRYICKLNIIIYILLAVLPLCSHFPLDASPRCIEFRNTQLDRPSCIFCN